MLIFFKLAPFGHFWSSLFQKPLQNTQINFDQICILAKNQQIINFIETTRIYVTQVITIPVPTIKTISSTITGYF
jgi:hypothetical protein